MQDNSSLSAELRDLEERLANSPDSFCFAKLSDLYLKQGSVDNALFTARQGVARHPAYLAGQRALALACHAKGLHDESLALLRQVTAALPEDLEALKLLGRLSNGIGDREAARRAYQTVLEFYPQDVESRLELQSPGDSAVLDPSRASVDWDDNEEIIEDLEILEELDVLEEDQPDDRSPLQPMISTPAFPASAEAQHDPLSTGTLAELYVSQGFIHKALDIYRDILADNPTNGAVSARVAELEQLAQATEPSPPSDEDFYEDESAGTPEALQPLMTSAPKPESVPAAPAWIAGSDLPQQGVADNALETLEGWLENIRRIKSCR